MSYRWTCPLCGMTAWDSRFDKGPKNLKFKRQISTGTGFQYKQLKHTSQPLQRFQNHYLDVLAHLLEEGVIPSNKVREVAQKHEITTPKPLDLKKETEVEISSREKLAELTAKASKQAKAEKEAKTEYETMKKQAEMKTKAEKEAKGD